MITGRLKRGLAFVVPTLSEVAAQNEDIVQLLIFIAARLEQEITERTDRKLTVTIISVEHNTSGWNDLSSLFSAETLKHVSIEVLEDPVIPNQAIASHKPAYNLFEFLKDRTFDEVHCLDRYGLAYYPTQARRLGLYFLDTAFVIHVVGGTIFHKEAEECLLDDPQVLMDDILERGSLERADTIYVHDRQAWQWYSDKIEVPSGSRIYDLAWAQAENRKTELTPIARDPVLAIVYYGSLCADGGLPLFCDAVGRVLPKIEQPVEVFFVGSPQAIGGMDAVSYIRLRSAKWEVPVTIKRELSILDEVAFIFDLQSVVVINTTRREGLRARLIAGSSLSVLHIKQAQINQHAHNGNTSTPYPGQIVRTLTEMLRGKIINDRHQTPPLIELWRANRPRLPDLEDITPSSSLRVSHANECKVSVCVTHYCRPQKLRGALASLMRQSYQNFEVIVVDDGSPDLEVQKELEKIREEIEPLGWRLLVQENRYLGAARNYGASHATGDYLLFMDDDNVAKPNEISILVAVAQRTGADIVTAFCDVFEKDSDLEGAKPPKMRFTPFGADPALGVFSNCYGDANALYSRQVFAELGGFTEDYGITHEDWELFCRASLAGVKMVCVPEPLFWYRTDPGGMFRGQRTQLHKSANLRRHIRPFIEELPYYQATLVQLAQGLTTKLPETDGKPRLLDIPSTVGVNSRAALPSQLRSWQVRKPYARVAVIMRTKDRPLLLRRAIDSVLNQSFKDWLLVIVNDGGSPESVDLVVDEVADKVAGQLLILNHPVSLGMQTASNAGITNCDSDFIIIHDDDDTWEPTFLARTVSHLDEYGWNPKLGGVITWSRVIVEEFCEDGEFKEHNQFVFNDKLYNISLLDLAVENRFPPISFLFRRAALDTVGPFKEQHGVLGDWDFHLRLLQRFDIDVIAEPIANYHHRPQMTDGVYGNSVHAQTSLHRSKRIDLLNTVIRDQMTTPGSLSLAHLLVLGNFQDDSLKSQKGEFQRLHDYLWQVEQTLKHEMSQLGASNESSHSPARNLARNGDFRVWPNPGKVTQGPDNQYAYLEICPGFLICYDGRQLSYRVERRKWIEDGYRASYGKTYLHIENDGQTKGGTWFNLECILPSALLLSGQTISISGLFRLNSPRNWIFVGGRYDLGDGRKLTWPDQEVLLSADFERSSFSISCPAIQETELSRGHQTRILLKLPQNEPFEFDLTNFQVEFGSTPTEFAYNGTFSLRERLYTIWSKTRAWSTKAKQIPLAVNRSLDREIDQ